MTTITSGSLKKLKYLLWSFLLLIISAITPDTVQGQVSKVQSHQNKRSANVLPLDKNVVTGKLANGFTYFIRRNTEPANRVQLYLANKVGSLQEEDDQLGLAHFLEHMNFNGTKNFPGNQMIDYLGKVGVSFGRDINASTDFEATIYQLPIPSDKPEVLKNGLQIMRDWAQDATLDPVEIDKERGVILEEKRMRNNAGFRLDEKTFPMFFNNSFHTKRMPIGTEEVLKNFKPETIRRFYADWYRPNLQALVVVGDIDVVQMEQRIKQLFGDLKNPANQKERKEYPVLLNGKNGFLQFTDKELNEYVVNINIKHPAIIVRTELDYKAAIIRELFNQMLNARMEELSSEPNQSYISANGSIGNYLAGLAMFQAGVSVEKGGWEKGFKAMWEIIERIKRFGFTAAELSRAKAAYLSRIEAKAKEQSKTPSEEYVYEYVNHFLKGESSIGIEAEFAMSKKLMGTISLDQVRQAARSYLADKNRDIIVMAPESDQKELPTEDQINGWINAVAEKNIAPYKDPATNIVLMTKKPLPGKVVSEKDIPALKMKEWVLSNGLKVVLKPTDFRNDEIKFNGFSLGGTSLYGDQDYQSAAEASFLISESGVGKLKQTDLVKFFSGKNISFSTNISERSESFDGVTGSRDLESFLQLLYMSFTQPRKDSTVFENFLAKARATFANPEHNPELQFRDSIRSISYNYNIRRTAPSLKKLDKFDLDKAYKLYKERFANAGDFTVVITGSFSYDKIKPLVEQYLGSLPANGKSEQSGDLYIKMKEGIFTKTVKSGSQDRASVELIFNGEYEPGFVNNDQIDALTSILQIKITERLRELEGGVYSPRVSSKYEKYPRGNYHIDISFGCSPVNVDKLIAAALDEVSKIKAEGPTEVDILKYKAENKKDIELALKDNNFWSNYLLAKYRDRDDVLEVLNYSKNMENLSRESLKKSANEYLSGKNLLTFILVPEK